MSSRDDVSRWIAIAVSLGCVLVLAVTLGLIAVPALKARYAAPAVPVSAYLPGTTVDIPASVYDTTPYTLLFFGRRSCNACQQSKPALAAIFAAARQTPVVAVTMITGAASRAGEVGFAGELGLEPSEVVGMELSELRLNYVPTVVLVDRQGRTILSHEGLLDDGREIIETIRSLTVPLD